MLVAVVGGAAAAVDWNSVELFGRPKVVHKARRNLEREVWKKNHIMCIECTECLSSIARSFSHSYRVGVKQVRRDVRGLGITEL